MIRSLKNIAKNIRDLRYADFLWELSLFARAPFAKEPETKFFIYGSARTGTTICLSLLSTHPNLVAEHEIFNQYHAKSKKDFDNIYEGIGLSHTPPLYFKNLSIENVAKTKCQQVQRNHYCFKLLSGQMSMEREKAFVTNRIKNGWKILLVCREDLLAVAVSYSIAYANLHKSSSWFGAKSESTQIDLERLMYYLKRFEAEQNQQKEILKDLPHLSLVYEDDFLDSENHQAVCNEIFNYLGMPDCQVSSSLKKQGSKELSNRVENWDELVQSLRGTRFQKFVEANS